MFFSTRSHEVNRIVRATPQTILETLHDPDVFFRLNPLVVSVTANPEPPHSYTVVDELLVLGCFKTTTTFTCVASFSDDGIECDIEAALGTRTRCSFHVKQGQDEGTSEIVYKVVVQGLSFLLPYIDKTQQKAHQMLLDRLGRHSEGESSRHDGD